MEQRYEYGIRLTRQDLDGHGGVERTYTEVVVKASQKEAEEAVGA